MRSVNDYVNRIIQREAVIGVVGLGYVGLPLVLEFVHKGFKVVGLDIDEEKIKILKGGGSYIRHIPSSAIEEAVERERFFPTSEFTRVRDTDAVLICVPTPLGEHLEPDLSYIEHTARIIAPHLHPDHLIVLESTTYPGTTTEVLVPLLESGSGLKAGKDFWVAFSPEREDPN
ncbi:MAG: NAD(P)-binding domain-containing protein, partial [bacterium]